MSIFIKRLTYYSFIIFCLNLTACTDSRVPQLKPLKAGDLILAFGDSLTYGTGASPDMNYPTDLAKIINFNVINAGMPGAETSDGLVNITKALEQNHPSLVILCLGTNDLIRGRSFRDIKDNLKKTIQLIQKTGADVVLVAVSFNLKIPALYQELGNELNILVDTKSLVTTSKVKKFRADPIHLNNEGYKVFARSIADFLKSHGALKRISGQVLTVNIPCHSSVSLQPGFSSEYQAKPGCQLALA